MSAIDHNEGSGRSPMSQESHTPEQGGAGARAIVNDLWHVRVEQEADDIYQCEGYLDCGHATVFSFEFCDQDQDEADAILARIQACLNACRNVPTEELELDRVAGLLRTHEAREAEVGRLREALVEPDLAGRDLETLLLTAARALEDNGPLADCLRAKAGEIAAALALGAGEGESREAEGRG